MSKGAQSRSRKDLTLKLNRHKSDMNMTPAGIVKGLAFADMEKKRKSKLSVDLKEEIIKDLTNKKYKKEGSRKFLKRNTSSQFSHYFERRMSNLAMGKLNNGTPSEHSARKIIEEVSHFTGNASN